LLAGNTSAVMGLSLANRFIVPELQVGVFYICYGKFFVR